MNKNSAQKPQEEEIDLGQLFNAIGNLFERLFKFIKSIFVTFFKIFIYALKPFVKNFKIITVIMMVFAIIGYVLEKFQNPVYVSDMLVRPHFESKYQLANNIDYFNALIVEGKYKELSNIFEIDSATCTSLIDFNINIGPQTKNELLKEYDKFRKSIDSTLAADVSFDDFVDNRDILDGSTFVITVRSKEQSIFKDLENGIIKSFKNKYSEKNKKIRDSSLTIQKEKLLKDLKRNDSLKDIYINVLQKDSEKQNLTLPSGTYPLTQERTKTREFELLQQEKDIRKQLTKLQELEIVESDFYDVLSSFEEVGTREIRLINRYSIVLPLIALTLMTLVFIGYNTFNFIKDYE